ncbi:MAG: APC family permease [Pseudomonadota bacterium]
MKYHKIGLLSLIFTGIAGMIGSGWLFNAYYAARFAGTGAYLVWLIGVLPALFLSLMLAEVVTLHPKRGLFARLLTLSHDHDTGYITALTSWLGLVAVMSAESVATIQYLASVNQHWLPYLYNTTQHNLTSLGLLLCFCLLLIFGLLNFWGVNALAKSNNILTVIKIFIPIIVAIAILSVAFHSNNFVTQKQHKMLPHGITGIFSAIMASGIIYSFNGFQAVSSFCAEAKNASRNVPLAMVIAIIISLLIYLLIQTAFIGGLPSHYLQHGWSELPYLNSPIVDLTALLGLNVISIIAYVGASLGPCGAGIVFAGSTTRTLTALSQEQQAPSFFNVLHPKYHFSRRSLVFNITIASVLLFFARNWHNLSILISMFHITGYLACPLALIRLRIKTPHRGKSSYRMPFATIICPLFFTLLTLLLCLTREKFLIIYAGIIVVFYLSYIVIHNKWQMIYIWRALQRSYMLPAFFVWLALVGVFGNPISGAYFHLLSHQVFYLIVIISALFCYYRLTYKYKVSPYFRH